jgi:hypothetical protein
MEMNSTYTTINRINDVVGRISNEKFRQKLREESRFIAAFEADKDYSISGELEVFEMSLIGISQQIIKANKIMTIGGKSVDEKSMLQVIGRIQDNSLFDLPHFRDWFNSDAANLPATQLLVDMLEYLRLLIFEFIVRRYSLKIII